MFPGSIYQLKARRKALNEQTVKGYHDVVVQSQKQKIPVGNLLVKFQRIIAKINNKKAYKALLFQSKQNNVKNQLQFGVWKVFNKSLESRKVAFKGFPGFQMTFSTVNHKIPLIKPEHYGIKGLLLNFLKHTKHFIKASHFLISTAIIVFSIINIIVIIIIIIFV